MKKLKFALIGAAGFVSKRHVQAIKELGHQLVLACDKHENVGFLDSYFQNCTFTKNEKKFFEEVKRKKVDYVVICTPNYLHFKHIIMSIKSNSKVICEKPLVIKKNEFKYLMNLKKTNKDKINIILQLRLNENLNNIKDYIESQKKIYKIDLTYITPRGQWYDSTWKAEYSKSGGIKSNIGIHLFDIVCQLFGNPDQLKVDKNKSSQRCLIGKLNFQNKLSMKFKLSINKKDLPKKNINSYRKLTINKKEFDLTKSFTALHKESYKKIINNKGFKIETYQNAFNLLN